MNRYQTRVLIGIGIVCALLTALLFKMMQGNQTIEEIASYYRTAEIIEFIDE